jgi:hypothetical protein
MRCWILVTEKHLSCDDAYILLPAMPWTARITQLVDGQEGVHALLPKSLFMH